MKVVTKAKHGLINIEIRFYDKLYKRTGKIDYEKRACNAMYKHILAEPDAILREVYKSRYAWSKLKLSSKLIDEINK